MWIRWEARRLRLRVTIAYVLFAFFTNITSNTSRLPIRANLFVCVAPRSLTPRVRGLTAFFASGTLLALGTLHRAETHCPLSLETLFWKHRVSHRVLARGTYFLNAPGGLWRDVEKEVKRIGWGIAVNGIKKWGTSVWIADMSFKLTSVVRTIFVSKESQACLVYYLVSSR